MSHDRGCFRCFADRWEYKDCRRADCPNKNKWPEKARQLAAVGYKEETMSDQDTDRASFEHLNTAEITHRHQAETEHNKLYGEDDFLKHLDQIAEEDAAGLKKAQDSYGNSWKDRGGVGAFMMLARKWDRLENRVKQEPTPWDIFQHIATDPRAEGIIDDVRDLRRYLMLVEAEMRARGLDATHRDNKS